VSLRIGVIASILVLGLAACGGEADVSGSASPSAAVSPGASAATTPASDVVEIKVAITGGRVVPRPSVHKVAEGRTVRIIVTSDEDDELHVHGYDLPAELKAGRPATIEFTADQAGRFEVETHERGLQLFQLQVS
jgi:plastocyanin